ncbi:Protein of unknown function [Pseudomonas sp. ok272]|uniref:heme-dependent oxidative N-demethylase family protein n=1 Tax=unclassified Pseudomonas TaxID=196821 RepID=UPI0008C6ADAE|nr:MULTISPECIES: DUF3445 domain-containing protein [unclassified Pseudomonas]SEM49392.1 Protein of unknown function [Pseudomonas sp. ok272]SFM20874.1 Protein of unknown function [Pseudomonas sp. ok602]
MNIKFNPDETYRDDYTFANSPETIARAPFPFPDDDYMYSMNLEPHVSVGDGAFRAAFDIDEHYISECRDRAITLEKDPGMHYVSAPHMMEAQWDLLELIMESYARDYPQYFSLAREGRQWHWTNRLLNIDDHFTFGDPATLPYEPMEYVTRQAQGDWVLQEERDGTLYWGAGIATQRADYSLRFNLGMSWEEFHGPVPLVKEIGMLDRALKFLLRLRTGHPVRRLNWSLTVNPRLEVSAESLPEWAPDRTIVTAENAGKLVYLRIELQPLHRLPRSNAIVFPIRTYLLSLEDIATNPAWARRMHRVLRDLNQQLVDYKGFSRYRDAAVEWLSKYDDGRDSETNKQA